MYILSSESIITRKLKSVNYPSEIYIKFIQVSFTKFVRLRVLNLSAPVLPTPGRFLYYKVKDIHIRIIILCCYSIFCKECSSFLLRMLALYVHCYYFHCNAEGCGTFVCCGSPIHSFR